MEAYDRRMARRVVNSEDIESERTLGNVALSEEVLSGANEDVLLPLGDAQFRKGGERVFADGTRADFDERERRAVVSYEIEFAFRSARHKISRDEDVAMAAKVPVSVSFATNARSAGNLPGICRRRIDVFAKTIARGPVDGEENQSGNNGHGIYR